jgi:hypothetical protein
MSEYLRDIVHEAFLTQDRMKTLQLYLDLRDTVSGGKWFGWYIRWAAQAEYNNTWDAIRYLGGHKWT